VSAINVNAAIPIIDLFAGPGGLGEGFAAFTHHGQAPFQVALSIEKDPIACATLSLRKYFRRFESAPPEFDAYFSGEISLSQLYAAYPTQAQYAQDTTWEAELGKEPAALVASRVRRAISDRRDWVLLGGPPCQAYSIAGRSRMRNNKDFAKDERHTLYREYLRIVADHEPAIFVMENVKGLLTSTHDGGRIVSKILDDLSSPGKDSENERKRSLHYRLYALDRRQAVLPWMEEGPSDGEEFLIKAESFGIPQNRHRIFIVGVRSDVAGRPRVLNPKPEISVESVLSDLPQIRSALSREEDSLNNWREAIADIQSQPWFVRMAKSDSSSIHDEMKATIKKMTKANLDIGARHKKHLAKPDKLASWYRSKASGITLHESRSHMRDDLHRYLFCACFAKIHGRSPKLRDFPKELFPTHRNITADSERNAFEDRFRVQLADQPATTITSHVSKDGHYYIHHDPMQCRSLTVREAARLQTFPDNYFFEGGRTEQYRQVGNAVPPLLAREIAGVVFDLLRQANHSGERLSAIG